MLGHILNSFCMGIIETATIFTRCIFSIPKWFHFGLLPKRTLRSTGGGEHRRHHHHHHQHHHRRRRRRRGRRRRRRRRDLSLQLFKGPVGTGCLWRHLRGSDWVEFQHSQETWDTTHIQACKAARKVGQLFWLSAWQNKSVWSHLFLHPWI